ncbi:hypothetical protein BO85DRAFT_438598 [Aspergillus piperis CBS 112811]|uniref:Uncharacterized protein n=1 Tax=Aspergillus piperis CBS 112811 TaxID=1448313 RepID=A0A8G1R4A6_9EURO|nr:hypothetical protein BO85DRAFT_438598 [Aspergillus piperis CBS 112811]RAH57480.1 hypothetical protein BO85DRAFT_438598 [Aspergillus piperis CBS 112811]
MAPAPSVERIRELFSPWETGDDLDFIDNCSCSGLQICSPGNHCDRTDFSGCGKDWVSISMASKDGPLLLNGKPYNQTYLWATKWDGEHIVEVEEYADFELLANAVRENLEERRARDDL